MSDNLQAMIDAQREFISRWVDIKAIDDNPEVMERWALDYIGHAIEELVELRKEFPSRKHWKQTRPPVDMEKVRDEFSDVLHFMINIGIAIGVRDSDEYRRIYDKKHQTNIVRQKTGY